MIQPGEIEEVDASLDLLMDYLGEDRTKIEANVVSRLTELFGSLVDAFKNNGKGIQNQSVVKAILAIPFFGLNLFYS